jgi:hypothetical protein
VKKIIAGVSLFILFLFLLGIDANKVQAITVISDTTCSGTFICKKVSQACFRNDGTECICGQLGCNDPVETRTTETRSCITSGTDCHVDQSGCNDGVNMSGCTFTAVSTPFCGDGACNGTEACATCPGDCSCGGGPVCGNGICENPPESKTSCPADCGSGSYGACGSCNTCGHNGECMTDPNGACIWNPASCTSGGATCAYETYQLSYPYCRKAENSCPCQGSVAGCVPGENCCTQCADVPAGEPALVGPGCLCACGSSGVNEGTPGAIAFTAPTAGQVTLNNNGEVVITWNRESDGRADRYEYQVYKQGSTAPICVNTNFALCGNKTVNSRSITFLPNVNGGNAYTVRVRGVNTDCNKTVYGGWVTVNFIIMANIRANFYVDNGGSATQVGGICQLGGATATNPGTGAAFRAQGQASNYNGTISGTTGTVRVPYWPPVANNIVTLTPGTDGTGTQYACTCPNNCQYTGIASPQTGLNYYFTAVDLTHTGWYQTIGGNIQAFRNTATALLDPIPTTTCTTAAGCTPAMSTKDLTDTDNSAGIAITGGGNIDSSDQQGANTGFVTERTTQAFAIGTTPKARENYDYFYRLYSLGDNPGATDDFATNSNDATKPSGEPLGEKRAFFHSGDLTIQQPWNVASNEKIVIFVDGNLTIADPSGAGSLIDVTSGGFLSFIVSDSITIAGSVGNTDLTSLNSNIEGVYIADGTLTFESLGTAGGGDKRFVGEGTFVGWGGVDLNRDFSDGGVRKAQNNTKPTETFIYRPDFVKNIPERMTKPVYVWQETN